jgi:hypothetical protein
VGLKNVVEYIDNHVHSQERVYVETRDKREQSPPPELFSVVPDLGF